MFTIRHIERDNHQCLWQAKIVYLTPGERGEQERVVFYQEGESDPNEIKTGMVYVMNDNGKTVAFYNLEDVRQKDKE